MKQSEKWLYIIAGILQIILAIYLIVNPTVNLLSLSWMLSFGILVGGISEIISYLNFKKENRDNWLLFSGIIGIIVGISLLSGSFITLPLVVPKIIGIWLIVYGIIRLVRAFKIRSKLPNLSNLLIWTGILSSLLGICVFFNPLAASLTIAYIIAISFLYQGVVLFMDAIRK
ncbi:DUF308 domain-containing protein [Gemella sp. GH3]|uniref:HdeD family acid-resistance protein n=1 Tax=unclassified Gemella TaxID=2624949 RepID=UPI0015D0AE28|nr:MULTISPECIES: DUF308 domain-containing protein [unclassified Gemella]MBF0713719.1 DUF308 domain-containing protein [Gemella sp. GH3.1]NYS50671.1 DUF308 domain-containing protein [Gemella sp. GH3]